MGIISAVKDGRICNRMSYITLRCHWRDIIVLNVRAPTEDKNDDTKGSLWKEVECVHSSLVLSNIVMELLCVTVP
jgi:hypothetical protein